MAADAIYVGSSQLVENGWFKTEYFSPSPPMSVPPFELAS
jgi:hypothetical protein